MADDGLGILDLPTLRRNLQNAKKKMKRPSYDYVQNFLGITINPRVGHWTLLLVDSRGDGFYLDPMAGAPPAYVPVLFEIVRYFNFASPF